MTAFILASAIILINVVLDGFVCSWPFMALSMIVACLVSPPVVPVDQAMRRLADSFVRPLWILLLAYILRAVH